MIRCKYCQGEQVRTQKWAGVWLYACLTCGKTWSYDELTGRES